MEVIYPGTFDPITNGHLDILKRSLKVFDNVTVLISNNTSKNNLFTPEERLQMAKDVLREFKNVEVKLYNELLVDYIRKHNVKVVVRGLRAVSDFEYEFQMAMTNRRMNSDYEVMFFITDMKYIYLSSSIVKELAVFNGDISFMVPSLIEKKLKEKFNDV